MNKTGIGYLDLTWGPVTGCSPVSEGCENCWAEATTRRFWRQWKCEPPPNHFKVKLHAERLDEPLRRKKPARIGVCFMSDLFHEGVESWMFDRIFDRLFYDGISHLTWMLLTKRPRRMKAVLAEYNNPQARADNVWLGATAENQKCLDERAPHLLRIPGKHWLSLEPLLSPLDLAPWLCLISLRLISLCVVGCESGPRRRPCKLEWILDIVRQCKAAGVPCYVKQIPLPRGGCAVLGRTPDELDNLSERFGWRVSHDPAEWPEELQVREMP